MAGVVEIVFAGISATCSVVQLLNNCKDVRSRQAIMMLTLSIDRAWEEVATLLNNEMTDLGKAKKDIQKWIRWCYDAEDLLEMIQLETQDTKVVKKIRGLWRRFRNTTTVEDELSDMLKLFNDMLKHFKQGSHKSETNPGLGNLGTHTLVGRDDDVAKITKEIFSTTKLGNNGFSIVGVFGVGKSSVAEKIYNDSKSCGVFHKSWVHLPDGKFVWKYVEGILPKSITNGSNKMLIVIDNLQSVTCGEWKPFQDYMKGHQEKDIRVIVTTCNPEIPRLTNTTLYRLKPLQDNDCGEVIITHAGLNSKDYSSDQRFKTAVESIKQKCDGLPIVAELYGAIMGSYVREGNWKKISERQSLLSELLKDVSTRFRSSIDKNLPPGFWRSICYLSLFPLHHHSDIEDLVHLLIGECFVSSDLQSRPQPISLKELTNHVVQILQRNSIIKLSPNEKEYEKINVVSEVVSHASSATNLRLGQDHSRPTAEDLKNIDPRHLSILYKPEVLDKLKKLRKLRTFLSLHDQKNVWELKKTLPELHKVIASVRVLSLRGTDVEELPKYIDELKHLRYLDISFTCIKILPKGICSLNALQFLKIEGITLSYIPPEFHKLTNLLYCDWQEALLRNHPIRYIGQLERLENLPLFKVGKKEGHLISELKNIDKLQGSLHIQDLDQDVEITDAKEANLKNKVDLTTIVLEWTENSSTDYEKIEKTLEALRFHKNMKELQLKKYGGKKLPGWITDTYLHKVQLFKCQYCSFFPTLGKLQLLEILVLENMDSITEISCRSSDETTLTDKRFPKLKTMELHNMSILKILTNVQSTDMLFLQQVNIVNCGEMVNVSFLDHMVIFKSLKIETSQNLSELLKNNQIRRDHIPRIEIDGKELPFDTSSSPTQA